MPVEPDFTEATNLLHRLSSGEDAAADRLLEVLHGNLHELARILMSEERSDHTLQPTALMHEAWIRLMRAPGAQWADRNHFLRVAARAMRRVLVDHARKRAALKRGGDRDAFALDDQLLDEREERVDLVLLDVALDKLADKDPKLAQIVELRFFAELTLEQTGEVMELSVRQVHRSWTFARGWLKREIDARRRA